MERPDVGRLGGKRQIQQKAHVAHPTPTAG
jgi:hypothetical protein